jgi:secreted PhoX family phosphatase
MQHAADDEERGEQGREISNRSRNVAFGAILQGYMSRRTLLKTSLAGLVGTYAAPFTISDLQAGSDGFIALSHSTEDKLLIPAGYSHDVVISWGDPVLADTPAFDPSAQSRAKQARQCGYNADFIAFMPLPYGSRNSDRGLLAINNEHTNAELMCADWTRDPAHKTRETVDIELAAHGMTIIEVQRDTRGSWHYMQNSPYNRRLTGESPMAIGGPAAGHPWLRTSYDSTGTLVRGTLHNCAGGITPWGTVLTAEENFNMRFGGTLDSPPDALIMAMHRRYGLRDRYGWGRYHDRFDIGKEPHEPLRFGWIVEIDPYDPQSLPMKHTALGRLKHEGATVAVAPSGQVVVYSGDDERFEYLYKFVSAGRYDPDDRALNMRLLDDGKLYVAKFHHDGAGEWLPLIFGLGPLTPANSFTSQAEVLINARRAADLLGATKMDRPEDIAVHPTNGKVYAVMTNNTSRRPEQVDNANPRSHNRYGHIIELVEMAGDHTATAFHWGIFITCGDPNNPDHQASYQGHKDLCWFTCPDNVAFDTAGRLWVATDGQPTSIQQNDAVYVMETAGSQRGRAKMFLSGPTGAELAGLAFTPDHRTLFVSIQHPGQVPRKQKGQRSASMYPPSGWPDYTPDMPPRPGVVAIHRQDGGVIGS